jgi:hypothetical protein
MIARVRAIVHAYGILATFEEKPGELLLADLRC